MRHAENAGIIVASYCFYDIFFVLSPMASSMSIRDCRPKQDSRTRCPRCGVAFDCGRGSQPFDCWCANLPPLPAAAMLTGAASAFCLCPDCYADALAAAGSRGAVRDPANS